MPESMFGRPLQHLLPSHPPASLPPDPHTAPVQHAPPTFKDFRFNSIGKQPELLSRISLSQLDHTDYHSPTPSPTSTPPPPFANDSAFRSSSRPTLLQLVGSDFSLLGRGSRWHASTSQPNGSLASRIQMDGSPSNDVANTAPVTASRFPSPPLRITAVRRAAEDASLIPPVEVLTQPSDSSPPTPASWAPALELADVHSPASSTPLMNTTAIMTPEIPVPLTVTTNITSKEPTDLFPSLAVVDAMMRNLQSSPSTATTIDSLVTRQERLQSISAKLANLASPLPPPSSESESPPPDSFSVTRANDNNIALNQSSQSQHSSTPIVLHNPYSAIEGRVRPSIIDVPVHTNDSSLALVPSPTTLVQEQTQRRAIIEAIQNLNSVLNAAHRAQIDNENALALQTRTFEEQRAAFEQTKRVEEATLRLGLQELQRKREELNAKEALLALLEKESKAREEVRRGVLAKRQVQEEEKRAAEAKRVQEVQEQIANAMDELKEIGALKAKCQLEQLASANVPDDLPTSPQEGMDEKETAIIKSRNDLLCAIKHLRRMHTDKQLKLEESNRTLRRLEEERKKKEAEEAERRRTAEEERLRAHAEMEWARQIQDEKRRQIEAERKRQEVENDREQPQLLIEQQLHTEAQAHVFGRTETISDQPFRHPSYPEKVSASQQQDIADTTRIRAAREENSLFPEITDAMNVDEDKTAFALRCTVPLSGSHTSPGGSPSTVLQSKQKDKPISGGVILAAPTPKVTVHLSPKPLAIPPSLSSSGPVAENAPNPAKTFSTVPVSAESFPAQLAPRFNRTVNADIRLTPDHKPAFPRTPKSQTILDVTNGGSQELNIGPVSSVSPAQQNVNLRHLKRFRGRVEGNDSGDRSVRTINVKSEDNSYLSPKREEQDDQSRQLVQASLSANPPASLPPRPAIIPPPRPRMPRKRYEPLASQTNSASSYPPRSNELSLTGRKTDVTTHEQPREALPQDTPISQAMDAPVQLSVPPETTNSLLLSPVYPEPRTTESRINAGERPTQDRGEIFDSTPSEPASATVSHELDEDPSGNNRRFSFNANGSRRMSDHYSPHRTIDSWRPQNSANAARAEPIRATSPTTGRKRPSEFSHSEHGHRARRHRGDVWVAQEHEWADPYRSHRDRRLESEPDERRAAVSPSDPIWPYSSDVPRTTYDNRTYIPPSPEEPATLGPRYRMGNDDTYQWQPSATSYNATTDQHYADDARVGQTYEPMTEERMDIQTDPSLLARIHDTQRFPPRGRGRGEASRGRSDFGRGRGRGVQARSGPPLIDRLTAGPSSLGNRLT